ncbi:MAG: hypothetical protein ABJB49_10660 [Nitrospirota bacterium]
MLSELISVENRIAYPNLPIPGFVGVGVSLRENRVKVGFEDAASLISGLAAVEAMGISRASLLPEIWGKFQLSSTWTDKFRPTRGGIQIGVINRTAAPWTYAAVYAPGSLGFNVRTTAGATYFMTAGHVPGQLRGINGVVGDTVTQTVPTWNGWAWTVDKIGVISINPPYGEGAGTCGSGVDFCTAADVAVGYYLSGVSSERKIGTSTYEGLNGLRGEAQINGFYSISVRPETVGVELSR